MILCVFKVSILVLAALLHYSDASPRLTGATVSTIDRFPYLAQLQRRVGITNVFNYHCTGALVSATSLVTAAHCFDGLYNNSPQQWMIRVSATNQVVGNEGFSFDPSNILIHDEYDPTTFDKDMAVVTWQFRLWESPTLKFIELNAVTVPDFSSVTIAGWGGINLAGGITNPLHFAVVPIVNLLQCQLEYAWHSRIVTANMMCAGIAGRGSCTNDRGLPLIYNSQLAGVSSWRIGCGGTNPPGVFTTILADDPWLLSALGIEGEGDPVTEENGGDGGGGDPGTTVTEEDGDPDTTVTEEDGDPGTTVTEEDGDPITIVTVVDEPGVGDGGIVLL